MGQKLNGSFRDVEYRYNDIAGLICWNPNKVIGNKATCEGGQ